MTHTIYKIKNHIVNLSSIVYIKRLFDNETFIGIRITFEKGARVNIYDTEVAENIWQRVMNN